MKDYDPEKQIKVSYLRCRHDDTKLLMVNDYGSCPKCGMGYFEVLFEQLLPIPREIKSQIELLQEKIAGRKADYNDLFKLAKASEVEVDRLKGIMKNIINGIECDVVSTDLILDWCKQSLKGPD